MIEVAGVAVPRAAIAKLAMYLQRDANGQRMLGHRLGHAIDKNLAQLPLTSREAEGIVASLAANPIDELEILRQHLLGRSANLAQS